MNYDPFLQSHEWRSVRMMVLQRDGAKCACCGATAADGVVICVDHIKPRRRYPELALTLTNLQVLCAPCNHGKGNKYETDWRRWPTPTRHQAEQRVIGGLLLDNGALARIQGLYANDFRDKVHSLLFAVTTELISNGKPADVVTLAEALQSLGSLDHVGGMSYLGELVENTPTATNIRSCAELVCAGGRDRAKGET